MQQVKILKLDIRAFDPNYGTVTFDFKIERKHDAPNSSTYWQEFKGSAIVIVTGHCGNEEKVEEVRRKTKIVWYQPDMDDPYLVDSDENLKDKMRQIAHHVIWEIRFAKACS